MCVVNESIKCQGYCFNGRDSAHCLFVSRSNWSDSRYPSWTNLQNVLAAIYKNGSTPTARLCQGQTDPIQDIHHEQTYKNVLAVVSKDRSAPTAWSCQVKLIRFKIAIVNKPTKCPGCCYKGQVSAHCLVVSRSNWFDSRYPSWNNLVSR